MPPLASRYLRRALAANDMAAFGDLLAHQFIDASEIWDLALHAVGANRSVEALDGAPLPPFSDMAVLPSRKVWIEYSNHAFACVERDDGYSVRHVSDQRISPIAIVTRGRADLIVQRGEWRDHEVQFACEVTEQILCMINQPGLVSLIRQPMDKRIERAARLNGNGSFALWARCHIQPGRHGRERDGDESQFMMPLHYVRKHHKPKASAKAGKPIWVDGFWRGNKNVGVMLKTYVPQAA